MRNRVCDGEDYYELLGLSENATSDQIKTAFRRLAQIFHPDLNPNDHQSAEHFKKLSQGYEILLDQHQRSKYDLTRNRRLSENGVSPIKESIEIVFSRISTVFQDLFIGEKSKVDLRNVPCLKATVSLTFGQAYLGCDKNVSVNIPRPCLTCRGVGQDFRGVDCQPCGGAGRNYILKNFFVPIPGGVKDGDNLQIEARVEQLPIIIELKTNVAIDLKFSRTNDDLITSHRIFMSQLLLGSSLTIAIPSSELKIAIPPGSKPFDVLRIKNRGFLSQKTGQRGDLLVRLELHLPQNISKQAEELIKRLANILPGF